MLTMMTTMMMDRTRTDHTLDLMLITTTNSKPIVKRANENFETTDNISEKQERKISLVTKK
jgi:hypothetical protein